MLHAGSRQQSPGLGSCTWEWPGQLQPHTSDQAVSAAAEQHPQLVPPCVTPPSPFCLLALGRQAGLSLQRLHQRHAGASCASTQVDGQCCYMLLWCVLCRRLNAGNTTSPANDNTFQVAIPPGLTPVGPITPAPGSAPGQALGTLGVKGLQMCWLNEAQKPKTGWLVDLHMLAFVVLGGRCTFHYGWHIL